MYELSAEQKAAVESESHDILVPAVAGSGKTHCLISRIRHLVQKGVDPAGIIAIPFTNSAVNTMRARLGEIKLGRLSTLHSFALSLIREQHSDASVLDEESSDELLEKVAGDLKYRGTKELLKETIALGLPDMKKRQGLVVLVAHEFYQTMLRQQSFSYDSLLVVARLLAGTTMWNKDGRFTHAFIDETQDGSDADFALYSCLNIRNWYYTGDDSQAIYSFRGGNVQNMLRLSADCEVHRLQTCYRSDSAICECADKLIAHNHNRIEKKTIPFSPAKGFVTITSHSTADSELLWLAQSVRDIQEGGEPLSEIAVLVRTNALVEHYTNGLKAFSIPVCERSEARLPEDWKRVMLLLSIIASPNNDFLMKRWLMSTADSDQAQALIKSATSQFKSINRCSMKWPDNPPVRELPSVCVSQMSSTSLELVKESISTLPFDATFSDLLVELRSNPPMETEGEKDGVTVSTIHRAKGLEWDTVFLPAFEDEIIPGNKKNEIEDNRRVAYVAITRARHRLRFSFSTQRDMPWIGTVEHHPSRFLAECGIPNTNEN